MFKEYKDVNLKKIKDFNNRESVSFIALGL